MSSVVVLGRQASKRQMYCFSQGSAIAEGPRDAPYQLKSCPLPRNSAETTCTTSPKQTRVRGLSCGFVCLILRSAVLVELRLLTDRQTDRQTDTDTDIDPWLVPRMHRAVKTTVSVKAASGLSRLLMFAQRYCDWSISGSAHRHNHAPDKTRGMRPLRLWSARGPSCLVWYIQLYLPLHGRVKVGQVYLVPPTFQSALLHLWLRRLLIPRRIHTHLLSLPSELSMCWVDPWVGLGCLELGWPVGSRFFSFWWVGLGWVQ